MTYYLIVEYFFILSLLVLYRHVFFRFRYFLHMAQLNGYKTNEFWKWMVQNWNKSVIPKEYYFLLFLVSIHIFTYSYFSLSTHTIVLSIAILFWTGPVRLYRYKQKKKLVFTPRMKRQTLIAILLTIPIPIIGWYEALKISSIILHPSFLTMSSTVLLIFIPILILLAGYLIKPVEMRIQEGFKKMAREKIASMPNLKVIAITGSYGKTSTKFLLRDILKERFNVLATPGSYNTPMGICKVINQDLNPNHQILILEMGARYKGNIQELCEIAAPDISVVTNVGTAHLETFGSQEAIASTKYEIIQYAKPDAISILNANDDLVMQMSEINTNRVISAGLEKGHFWATNIQYDDQGCSFIAHTPASEEIEIKMPLLGAHNVQNMILGVAVAQEFGMRLETITVAAKNMKAVEHRLELKKAGNYFVIDDAFNSNPVGAKNAVDILSQFKTGKRIIITPGMVELGPIEYEENKKFGLEIGKANIEWVLFIGQERSKPLVEGYNESNGDSTKMKVFDTLFQANEFLHTVIDEGDVVLYENDLPDSYNEK